MISGIERNSITFSEIEELAKGKTLQKTRNNVFYKNISNLAIEIKNIVVSIAVKPSKKLVNNFYYPLDIYNLSHKFYKSTYIELLKSKLIKPFKNFR